jgi:spore protease
MADPRGFPRHGLGGTADRPAAAPVAGGREASSAGRPVDPPASSGPAAPRGPDPDGAAGLPRPEPGDMRGAEAGEWPERLGEVRTDLAIEAARSRPGSVPGVEIEEQRHDGVTVSRVRITTPEAEAAVGKRMGRYVTLDAPELRRRGTHLLEQLARLVADELGRLLDLTDETSLLVVGLGNWQATPDALGPRVVNNLLVTRHLREQVPDDLRGGLRSVAAIAPGVLGLTGIETGEIIRGVVDRVRPDVVVAVDALASRSIERILTTIQLADTGIHPGSGVGNDRGGLNEETLGCPVVALGVPTVVHATTIAYDTIELLAERLAKDPAYRGLAALRGEERRRLIEQVLSPSVGDLMVTPKEIDVLMEDMAKVIAGGINAAVHPRVAGQPALF